MSKNLGIYLNNKLINVDVHYLNKAKQITEKESFCGSKQ